MSYEATSRGLEGLTDDVGFERLATVLLARAGINVRPLGGPGDRDRDAVAGLYRAEGGEPLTVTISLHKDWRGKIRADLRRINAHGFRPKAVIAVTNRPAGPRAQATLQEQAKKEYGLDLTIHDRRWLVTQLHRRDNLDLRGEYLPPPPRPRFFLDLGEFENMLKGRGLLEAPFGGRHEELDELECPVDGADGLGVVAAGAGVGGRHPHGTQADAGDVQVPQLDVLHGRCVPFEGGGWLGHLRQPQNVSGASSGDSGGS
jgi:hypothetical protein